MSAQQSLQDILQQEGIVELDKDLRRMTQQELSALFGAQSSGRVLLMPLLKSVLWQAYGKIRSGQEPPIRGNIRTAFYRWVKPVLSHIADDDSAKTDPYDTMLSALTRMVLELKLFRYADLDLTDENWENRRIGTSRPEVLVFAEKSGWIRFLREVHEELGVSVLALGGAPSALTSEYTASHISQALHEPKPVRLIGIVDYDPSGHIIAEAFRGQLQACGLPNSGLELLIRPEHYSAEELEIFRFPLPKGQQTKTKQWLERTGGVGGEPWGLESESMPWDKARQLVRELVLQGQGG